MPVKANNTVRLNRKAVLLCLIVGTVFLYSVYSWTSSRISSQYSGTRLKRLNTWKKFDYVEIPADIIESAKNVEISHGTMHLTAANQVNFHRLYMYLQLLLTIAFQMHAAPSAYTVLQVVSGPRPSDCWCYDWKGLTRRLISAAVKPCSSIGHRFQVRAAEVAPSAKFTDVFMQSLAVIAYNSQS
jgi:hypothetical protein